VVPGSAEKSLRLAAVNQSDPAFKMPPAGKLTPEEIEALTQ